MNRFAPDFANGFVFYEGRAPEKEYPVDFAYTVVRGEYRAEGADGKPRAIELSRDSGKTWREMPAEADGTVRLDYAVRGYYHYAVRAKGGEPSRFRAMTELQMNPRVMTGLAHGGENEFLLTAQKGGAALEVLNAVDAKWIAVSFPTRTLSGRNVGMAAHYAAWMETHLPPGRAVADAFEAQNELFYVLKEA